MTILESLVQNKNFRNKAVLIGLNPTGLVVARALAKHGVDVIAVTSPLKDGPELYTKCCRIEFCDNIGDQETLVNALIKIAKKEDEKPVLFMSGDTYVRIVSENREVLSRHFAFSLPEKAIVRTMLEKSLFAEFSDIEGFAVPKSTIVSSVEAVREEIQNIRYPCVVKPSSKNIGWERKTKAKVCKIRNQKELISLVCDTFENFNDDFIIQEWIPGDDADVFFTLMYYDRDSKMTAYFTGRKLLQWSPETGSTCIAENVYSDVLRDTGEQVFNRLSYKGIGSIEFKLDRRTNEFFIIEPTVGRVDLQSAISLLQGINIPMIYYAEMIEKRWIEDCNRSRRVIWINEDSLLQYVYDFGLSKIIEYGILRKLILFRKGFAYLCLKDVKPFIALVYHYFQAILLKIEKKFEKS